MTKQAARWNIIQLQEKLQSLSKDVLALARDMQRNDVSSAAVSAWAREVAGYLKDMSSLLAHEMSASDKAVYKADDLRSKADVLAEWAAHPTDATGNAARAAQLRGVANSIAAFSDGLL